ncbi:VOC family protein [Clostridiaceae bacterium M8S5]|nr:VOC family protein [Clostridiaceae bacterium M8S5]
MLRSMMQVYVKGSVEAALLYQKAFDAKLVSEHKNDEGSYIHAELDVYGQILALSEAEDKSIPGNTMQFCLHFGEDNKELVEKAFRVLEEDAQIFAPLGPCFFSSCMVSFIDKFGVSWCLFA